MPHKHPLSEADADLLPARKIHKSASLPTLSPPLTPSSPLSLSLLPASYTPLTHENLGRWSQQFPQSASSSMAGSVANIDENDKLYAYNIRVAPKVALPAALKAHTNDVVNAPRTTSSPAAKALIRAQLEARDQSESKGIEVLLNDLLFRREAAGGEPLVMDMPEAYLNRKYLPEAPKPNVAKKYGNLSQPVVDTAIGYIKTSTADMGGVRAPFTREEQLVVMPDAITSNIHFPFLTCQWKSCKGSQGDWYAMLQGARDGASINNYLHTFYTEAGMNPSVVDTCHWSLTCDLRCVVLYIHWRAIESDQVVYYMQEVEQEFLRSLKDEENTPMVQFRHRLRNILDYAVGERLTNIKRAIPKIEDAINRKRPASSTPRKGMRSHTASDQGYGGSPPGG